MIHAIVDSRDLDDGIHDREDEWIVLGRGPGTGDARDDVVEYDARDRDFKDWRDDRDRDARGRDDDRGGLDPRDVFMRDLDLPDSRDRELVHERDRDYTIKGSDTRTLSTIGAFRVVSARDLRDPRDAAYDERADLRHLEKQGLIEHVPLDGRHGALVLTDRGRSLLEAHRRDRDPEHRQAFYAGADRARESSLVDQGGEIHEVREAARHKDIRTTERYMKAREDRLKALMSKLAHRSA